MYLSERLLGNYLGLTQRQWRGIGNPIVPAVDRGADCSNTQLPAPLVPLMGVHKDVEVTPEQETLGVPGGHVEVLVGPSKLAAHRHTL